jgi:hypothetical protein
MEQADEYALDELERLVPNNTGSEPWFQPARDAIREARFQALMAEADDRRTDAAIERARDRAEYAGESW